MKKTLCIILSFMLLCISCGENETLEADNTDSSFSLIPQAVELDTSEISIPDDTSDTAEEIPDESKPDGPLTISDFDVYEIGAFYNGLARFKINDLYSVTIDESSPKFQLGQCGYIDTTGKVILEPIYTSLPQTCEYPVYAQFIISDGTTQSSYNEYIYPGNESFNFTFTDNMDKFSESASNGLFWVRSIEKKLSGNVYTMNYYDETGVKVFSIENATDLDNGRSDFNEYGYALVSIDGIGRMIDTEGNIVEFKHENGGKITITDLWGSYDGTVNDINVKNIYGNIIIGSIMYTYESYGRQKEGGSDYWMKIDFTDFSYEKFANQLYTTNPDYISDNYIYNDRSVYSVETFTKLFEFDDLTDFEGARINTQSVVSEDLICLSLYNKDYVHFATVVDLSGKITMQPTTEVSFGTNDIYGLKVKFQDGLCPALHIESGLWGYIDSTGYWKIIPQFQKANNFSEGYAHVHLLEESGISHNAVIDTNGDIVFEY